MNAETHRDKSLRLALIGMSGAGKTFWTKRLAAGGGRVCRNQRRGGLDGLARQRNVRGARVTIPR